MRLVTEPDCSRYATAVSTQAKPPQRFSSGSSSWLSSLWDPTWLTLNHATSSMLLSYSLPPFWPDDKASISSTAKPSAAEELAFKIQPRHTSIGNTIRSPARISLDLLSKCRGGPAGAAGGAARAGGGGGRAC